MKPLRLRKLIAALVVTGAFGLAGLTAQPDDASLLVGSVPPGQILRYNATTGVFIDVFVPAGSGGLMLACCPVFGPDQNLYLSSIVDNRILRYDGVTGAFIDEFVSAGSGGLAIPILVLFGPDENLYVGSVGTNSILRYSIANGHRGSNVCCWGLSGRSAASS